MSPDVSELHADKESINIIVKANKRIINNLFVRINSPILKSKHKQSYIYNLFDYKYP